MEGVIELKGRYFQFEIQTYLGFEIDVIAIDCA